MTSPAPDVSPSIWTDYTYDSELDNAERRSLSVFDAARVPEGESWKPVAYASRSLTETEKRYSQIEKETLGVLFGSEKFHGYVYDRS